MNWINFDINDKKTYPVFEEGNIIVGLINNFYCVLDKEYVLNDLKAYTYIAPYERKFETLQALLSKAKSLMTCKPYDLKELEEKKLFLNKKDYAYLLSKVEIHKRSELFEEHFLLSYFNKQVPQFFILEINNDFYMVDTQGYNYCRYMVKIELENNNSDFYEEWKFEKDSL